MATTVKFDVKDFYGKVRWRLPFPGAFLKTPNFPKEVENAESTSPQTLLGVPLFGEVELGGIKFPIPPTITISATLETVKSKIAGMDGTVKEVLGISDYNVNLKLLLTNNEIEEVIGTKFTMRVHKNSIPEDRLREIRELFENKQSQKVVSPLLNVFNIQYLLIESISIPDTDEWSSVLPVELTCVSDKPLEIRLNQN